MARDKGGSSSKSTNIKVTVYVTRNPTCPKFSQSPYTATINETVPENTRVVAIEAIDDDGVCIVMFPLTPYEPCKRKPDFCECKNKGADQLRSNCEADQCLCFCYSGSTIPLLLKSEISSFYPSSVAAQTGLCETCWKPETLVFLLSGSYCIALSLASGITVSRHTTIVLSLQPVMNEMTCFINTVVNLQR